MTNFWSARLRESASSAVASIVNENRTIFSSADSLVSDCRSAGLGKMSPRNDSARLPSEDFLCFRVFAPMFAFQSVMVPSFESDGMMLRNVASRYWKLTTFRPMQRSTCSRANEVSGAACIAFGTKVVTQEKFAEVRELVAPNRNALCILSVRTAWLGSTVVMRAALSAFVTQAAMIGKAKISPPAASLSR